MAYFLRRLGFYLVALWVAVTMNFLLPRMMPGDPIDAIIARNQGRLPSTAIAALRAQLGLGNAPLWQQYLSYLGNLLHGNLGFSFDNYPATVVSVMGAAIPYTIGLIGVALLISAGLGTLLGIIAAWRRGGLVDRLMPPVLVFVQSIPAFWVGLILIYFIGLKLQWFPVFGATSISTDPNNKDLGYYLDLLDHAILPAATLVLVSIGGWMVGMRNAMLNTLAEDHVVMAEAKGLTQRRIMYTYAARNAILPQVASFANALGFIIGGQFLIEYIFSYPGIGFLSIQAVFNEDYPLIEGIFLFIAIAVLVANFLADIAYAVLDPRVRDERR
ncbi:MAG: ABC transporter permease [Ktedonobacterales bacterium]